MRKKVENVCIIDDDLIYQFLAKEEIEYTNLVGKIMFFDDGEKALNFIKTVLDNDEISALPK